MKAAIADGWQPYGNLAIASYREDRIEYAQVVVKYGTAAAVSECDRLRVAPEDLVRRCDGAEGVRADESNIDTTAAHAAQGG